MTQLDKFNGIARYYDFLKGVVFGKAINNSQVYFLNRLTHCERILILGGGSGELLPPLLRLHSGSTIWFVEASSEMLWQAAKRLTEPEKLRIRFIHGTQHDLPPDVTFDAVIANFFFDLFLDRTVLGICERLQYHTTSGSVWLATDFVDSGKRWQRGLLSIMYGFFRWTCDIEARKLPSWEEQLHTAGLRLEECNDFYSGFIRSCIFVKSEV